MPRESTAAARTSAASAPTILAVDIGTTAMKMGVYRAGENGLTLQADLSRGYKINTYNNGLFGDIEPEKWQDAFVCGCRELESWAPQVDVIALSGTTPGMTAMGSEGEALYPAILMLDQRSRKQAQEIIDTVGLEELMAATGNMPVAGGCSLAGILWLRDNEPEVYRRAAIFGHSNTFMARWLTGEAAVDPSSASLSALYNTVRNDLTWNREIAGAFGLDEHRLPRLMRSHESPGRFRGPLAEKLEFRREPPVVIGGNDAVLAAYSAGIREPGQAINVNGTCEITLICLPECYASREYNVRAHVIPDRWLTLYVMNAGGEAFEWFRGVFCGDMPASRFYGEYLPETLERRLAGPASPSEPDAVPARDAPGVRGLRYVPYLMGSRYSLQPLTASFSGMTRETTRNDLLTAMVRGLCEYQRAHLEEVGRRIPLADTIHVTGGAAGPALIRAKERWMRKCRYDLVEQSSLKGAAMLGAKHLQG